MSKLRLNFACGPYDRTQALRDGSIQAEGISMRHRRIGADLILRSGRKAASRRMGDTP